MVGCGSSSVLVICVLVWKESGRRPTFPRFHFSLLASQHQPMQGGLGVLRYSRVGAEL